MPFLHPPKARQPLWKEWDYKAQRKGILYNVYSVKGNVYSGQWLNNKKHGKGVYAWKETNLVYTGDWKKDKKSGLGTLTHSDKHGFRKVYSGGWKNNFKDGYGTAFYTEMEFYEGEWSAGMRSGWGRMYYKDGTIYEGEWSEDKRSGQGMLRLNNENRYEGTWNDDKKNGAGKFYYLDSGQVFEGYWKDDVPRCGVMRDYGRSNAPDPTPYPIPIIKLDDPDSVIEAAGFLLKNQDHDM